jgi:hypothetical protein
MRRVRTLVLLGCVAVIGCGGSDGSPGEQLDPIARKHAYAEAKDVCRELGVDGLARKYRSAPHPDVAARTYAKKFLEPYRDAVYRGCRAGFEPVRPDEVTCAQLRTRRAARQVARKLVDRVVAPEGQSERETIGGIGESLYVTCRQPRIPGVKDIDHYRPVEPVLREVQRDFDQEEVEGMSGAG